MSATRVGGVPTSNSSSLSTKELQLDGVFPPTVWVRDPSWPACEAPAGSNKIVGLYAVWDNDSNFIAFTMSGNYTVDFGDGTTTNFTGGSAAYYNYSYSSSALDGTDAPVTFTASTSTVNRTAHGYTDGMTVEFFDIVTTTGISTGPTYYVVNATANTFQVAAIPGGTPITLTGDGSAKLLPYKIATVTITPQAGANLTSVDFRTKHNQSGLTSHYSTGWLDIAVAGANITSIFVRSFSSLITHNYLERVRFNQLGNVTGFNEIFYGCGSLKEVFIAPPITTVTNCDGMFRECRALLNAPTFTMSSVTSAADMFRDCVSLVSVNMGEMPLATSLIRMFQACTSLRTVFLPNTSSATTAQMMFSGCSSLTTASLPRLNAVLDMSDMFSNCYSLKNVFLGNTGNATNMNSAFFGCSSLLDAPFLDTKSATGMNSMFSDCVSLRNVPAYNVLAVTSMASMFYGCRALKRTPSFITSALTNTFRMFYLCGSLETVGIFNTANVTDARGMFFSCTSLQEIPDFDLSKITSAQELCKSCFSLRRVPNFKFGTSLTSADFAFAGCRNIEYVPLLNFQSVTNMQDLFAECFNLKCIAPMNFSAATNLNRAFFSCRSLTEIPTVSFASATTLSNTFANCYSLSRVRATGIKESVSFVSCKLSSAALNEIYTNLDTVTGKTITVNNNFGNAGDDPTIATAKGWTVSG